MTKEKEGVVTQEETTIGELMGFLKENMLTKEDAKLFATKEDFALCATKEDFDSLRSEVRVIDERTERIENELKTLRKTTFDDVNALTDTMVALDIRVKVLEKNPK